MKSTYDLGMTRGVFPHEGGYTNDAADPGGPTNWGITIGDARMYWKSSATAIDVRNMPKSVAEDIYAKHYAAPLRYEDLPAGLDYTVLDYGINSGVGRAGKVLRRVLGLPDNDWHVTDAVLAAIARRNVDDLIVAINAERLAFLKRLKTWPVFGAGWGRRVAEVKALSLHMAADARSAAPIALPALSNAAAPGKGLVAAPPPPIKQIVIKGAVPAALPAGGLAHVFAGHPIVTGAAVIGSIVVLGGVAYALHRNHRINQEAPTPGLVPVPLAA